MLITPGHDDSNGYSSSKRFNTKEVFWLTDRLVRNEDLSIHRMESIKNAEDDMQTPASLFVLRMQRSRSVRYLWMNEWNLFWNDFIICRYKRFVLLLHVMSSLQLNEIKATIIAYKSLGAARWLWQRKAAVADVVPTVSGYMLFGRKKTWIRWFDSISVTVDDVDDDGLLETFEYWFVFVRAPQRIRF